MAKREQHSFWQSYADLGMGLMAVFALILLLLLYQARERHENIEDERRAFAIQLLRVLESSQSIIDQQKAVKKWMKRVFDGGGIIKNEKCTLRLENGQLVLSEDAGITNRRTAQLYSPGKVDLTSDARNALDGCKDNLMVLAKCLAGKSDHLTREEDKTSCRLFGKQLQALVLQGNTDLQTYWADRPPGYRRLKSQAARTFVDNAFLGSERARRALAYLLKQVDRKSADKKANVPTHFFMRRIRVESPSFGKYQAGPRNAVWTKCQSANGQMAEPCCGAVSSPFPADKEERKCAKARNLSLGVRWKVAALRKPFENFKKDICKRLNDSKSWLYQGLKSAGKDIERQRRRYCSPRRKAK